MDFLLLFCVADVDGIPDFAIFTTVDEFRTVPGVPATAVVSRITLFLVPYY
jgi:hypothetical protein